MEQLNHIPDTLEGPGIKVEEQEGRLYRPEVANNRTVTVFSGHSKAAEHMISQQV